MKRLAIFMCVVAGCSGADTDPPWDPGDPLPASCSGESALETTIEEAVFAFDDTVASASRATTALSSPVVLAQPWQTLQIQYSDLESGALELPDTRVRIMYSMNPNGSEAVDNINLDTEPPSAANWYLTEVDGILAFGEAGVGVGERRCGWIDATLRWQPVGDDARSLRLRAAFDAEVEEVLTDR